MKFSKEFKEAVLHLSEKEKDKLLLRLLKKDKKLVDQLYFELLDDKNVEERRQELEEHVKKQSRSIAKEAKSLNQLKVLTSFLSGDISAHVRTTKDKFGEISLNILMLTTVIKNAEELFEETHPMHAQKFCVYVVARSFKILVLLQKMHEDILLEFEETLPELGKAIASQHVLMKTAINHGLDVNWLIVENNIPEDIAEIQKEVKSMGFLR